jgi:antitoxin HicB
MPDVRPYIALIHKDADGLYGVSFPDLPGHIAAGDTIEEALTEASDLLALLDRHWVEDNSVPMPLPSDYVALVRDPEFDALRRSAIIAAVPVGRIVREAAE